MLIFLRVKVYIWKDTTDSFSCQWISC